MRKIPIRPNNEKKCIRVAPGVPRLVRWDGGPSPLMNLHWAIPEPLICDIIKFWPKIIKLFKPYGRKDGPGVMQYPPSATLLRRGTKIDFALTWPKGPPGNWRETYSSLTECWLDQWKKGNYFNIRSRGQITIFSGECSIILHWTLHVHIQKVIYFQAVWFHLFTADLKRHSSQITLN